MFGIGAIISREAVVSADTAGTETAKPWSARLRQTQHETLASGRGGFPRIGGHAPLFGQSQQDEPTQQEIADAYQSKLREFSPPIPGVRWERWRIKEIRGWSLHFKRVKESRLLGVWIRQYQAIAKKQGWCAEYDITERIPTPPPHVQIKQIKSTLVVEPGGVKACR